MRQVYIETPYGDSIEGTTSATDAEMEGTFTVLTNDGERVNVNGWCVYIEIIHPVTFMPVSMLYDA